MVSRIDLFMPPLSRYSVLHHFTKKMHEALERQGVKTRLLEAKRNDPGEFLKVLFENPPECTLSFNGLLPDTQGNFFCDLIKIPHISYLVDSPNSFLSLINSSKTILTCIDRFSVEFLQGLGFKRAMFLPHAVEKTISYESNIKREYDVVFLGSCIDYETVRASWKKKFLPPLCQAIEEAGELALSQPEIPSYQALVQVLERYVNEKKGLNPNQLDLVAVLKELETYILGKDRVELLKAIKDAKVDVFGSPDETGGWKKYLGKKKNIVIHDPVPFEQAIDIMKHTKILLNSYPSIRYGGHERIFTGLASGALVVTDENPFLRDCFKDAESIVFYQHKRLDKANHRINEYLADVDKRAQVVKKGQSIVMKGHTWDHRAAQLLKELPALLKATQS